MRHVTAIAAVSGCLLAPAMAEASLAFEEKPIPSETQTFRGLVVTDISGLPDAVTIDEEPTPPGSTPRSLNIHSATGIANIPPSCREEAFSGPSGPKGPGVTCPPGAFNLIVLDSGLGDDAVRADAGHPALTHRQIDSPDTPVYFNFLLGEGRDQFVSGVEGTDFVNGGGGRDSIFGGPSNDLLEGGSGKDRIAGDSGRDLLFGGRGADTLFAGVGVPDLMVGGGGRDKCIAGELRDRVAKCDRVTLD